jgi:hypothetical protein
MATCLNMTFYGGYGGYAVVEQISYYGKVIN